MIYVINMLCLRFDGPYHPANYDFSTQTGPVLLKHRFSDKKHNTEQYLSDSKIGILTWFYG